MSIDSPNNNAAAVATAAVVPPMDLVASVTSRYNSGTSGGEAGIQRLLWIADKHPDPTVQQASYRAIAQLCLQSGNVSRYKQVFGNNQVPGVVSYNAPWVSEQEGVYRQGRDVLQHRLQAAQSQLHKDAIRTAYLALAQHDVRAGEMLEAFHSLLRAKDYCTNRYPQTTTVSLQIVELCLLLKNYAAAGDYINKLEHTLSSSGGSGNRGGAGDSSSLTHHHHHHHNVADSSSSSSDVVKQKVKVASALKSLASGDFSSAATKFRAAAVSAASSSTSTEPSSSSMMASMGGAPSGSASTGTAVMVLAPEDVALYAAFLTLCCGTNQDMIFLAEHPEALELVPSLREALLQFAVHCNYQECWKLLDFDQGGGGGTTGMSLQYDVYMAPHLAALQQRLRERCIANYWKPYQRVELTTMAQDLRGIVDSVDSLKELLVQMMLRHALDTDPSSTTRINLTSLHRDEPRQPRLEQSSDKLQTVTQTVLNDMYSMTIRLACLEKDLIVSGGSGGGGDGSPEGGGRRTRGGGRRGRGGGGGGGGMMKLDYSDVEEEGDDDDDDDSNDDDDLDTPMIDAAAGDMNPEDLY